MTVETTSEKTIHVGARTSLLPSEIVLMTADINYTIIHLSNGKKMMVSYHLGELQKRLISHKTFVRVNRKSIVNLAFLGDFNTKYMMVQGQEINYSRRRKSMVIGVIERMGNPDYSQN